MDQPTILAIDATSPLFPAFIELPWRIYPGRTDWVPPLKGALALELSPHNLFFTHGEAQAFVAMAGDEVVGRIVASVDHALLDPTVGHFGYFEAVDDPTVAKALLDAAEAWVRERGKTAIHGPVNLSIFHQYRIQTAGFERPAFVGEPRTPPYYETLLGAAGYAPIARWNSWDVPCEHFGPFFEALAAKGARRADRLSRYRMVPFDLARFDEECLELHPVVCDTFRENYGFTQITASEFVQRFQDARHMLSVESSHKAYDEDGTLVAYSYTYVDAAPDFQRADGDHTRLSFSPPEPTRPLVCHTFGILRAHRNVGIAEKLFEVGFPAVIRRHQLGIGALAKERLLIYARFGPPTRGYAVLGKSLEAAR